MNEFTVGVDVVVKQKELDHMNQLICTLVGIPEFAEKVSKRVVEVVENDPLEYVDESGNPDLDKDTLIDKAIEMEFLGEYGFDSVPTIIYEAVHEEFDHSIWDDLEALINEVYKDAEEYKRDPLGYHGMSQRDFI